MVRQRALAPGEAPGRTLGHIVAFIGASALVAIAATVVTRAFVPPAPSPWHRLVMVKNALLPVAELAAYVLLVRRLERRFASEIALSGRAARGFGFGLAVGFAIIAAAVLSLWMFGVASIMNGTGGGDLLAEILVPFTTAVVEELLFRGILFRLTARLVGLPWAAVISSLLFGAAHLGNPGATEQATIFLAVDLGLLLAAAYAASDTLWMPIGIHMGWNIALGYGFGTLNSGVSDPKSLLHTRFAGPAWLTGGAFGLEGSLVTLALSIVVTGAFVASCSHRSDPDIT